MNHGPIGLHEMRQCNENSKFEIDSIVLQKGVGGWGLGVGGWRFFLKFKPMLFDKSYELRQSFDGFGTHQAPKPQRLFETERLELLTYCYLRDQ